MAFWNGYPYTDFHELNLDLWISKIKTIEKEIVDIYEKLELPEREWERLQEQIDALDAEIEAIENGSLLDQYTPAILEAIDNALPELVGRLMRFFTFGLTQDGYFSAMYPDNFDDIQFDTIADPDSDLYGHLVLQY